MRRVKNVPDTFTRRLRKVVAVVVTPIGETINAWGVSPDVLTVVGLIVVGFGAWRVALGEWTQAAVILLLGLPLDTLDGAVARAYGKYRPFGSFLDSTLDRYSDALIFGAVAWFYADQRRPLFVLIALIALHGAMMVSYIRAKAESIDVDCEIGLFSRVERLLTLLFAWLGTFVIGNTAIDIGICVLAAGTQFTSLQRMVYVARRLAERNTAREKEMA